MIISGNKPFTEVEFKLTTNKIGNIHIPLIPKPITNTIFNMVYIQL